MLLFRGIRTLQHKAASFKPQDMEVVIIVGATEQPQQRSVLLW